MEPDGRLAELIVENATDYAIFTMTAEGVIRSWNPGAVRIFGYNVNEAVGMDFRLLFGEPDRLARAPEQELTRALADDRAEDTRWHRRRGGEMFWSNGVTMKIGSPDGGPELLKILRDETALRMAEDQRILLLNELNHRIKNTLATVQSITEQTLRAAGVDSAVRTLLGERLMALSEAHNVLVQQNWAGADLETIIRGALAPHQNVVGSRFDIAGPMVRLSPNQAVIVSLALHELATNAAKYGSLSADGGRVSVSWNESLNGFGERQMNLLWEERGGPPVAHPSRSGFGTRLLERAFISEAGGAARIDFAPDGVRCVMTLGLSLHPQEPLAVRAVAAEPEPPQT